MKLLIAHAAWLPERKLTLARLLEQLPNAHVQSSARREHATQWAYRAWEWVAQQYEPVVLLNDDITVCRGFWDVVHAMVEAAPDRVISLHTSAPGADKVTYSSWVRCYWLTGPGYILTPAHARSLLDYWASLPWTFASRRNEDNIAIHWMWERQEPAWSSVPALVTHDTGTASSLGYDEHPLRSSCVPWEKHDGGADLTTTGYWNRAVEEPPFLENPWAKISQLEKIRAALRVGQACEMCWTNMGLLKRGGITLCGLCLDDCVGLILKNARIGT